MPGLLARPIRLATAIKGCASKGKAPAVRKIILSGSSMSYILWVEYCLMLIRQ